MARCETSIDQQVPLLTSCPDDNEELLFFNSATPTGMARRKWSTVKSCIACDFFGAGTVIVSGTLFDNQGRYFNSALPTNVIVYYTGQPNFLIPTIQWTYITSGGNVIGIHIDPIQMPIDPAGYVFIIPNPIGCAGGVPSPAGVQTLYNYSLVADGFVVPNVNPAFDGQVITVAIKPNGFTYTWDTGFEFTDSYPEQPFAIAANTIQVYTFTYLVASGKFVCTNQSLNGPA